MVLKNRKYQPYLQVFFAFTIGKHLDIFIFFFLFLYLFWELWCLLDQELNIWALHNLSECWDPHLGAFSESLGRALLLDRCIFFFFLWMADGLGLSQCPVLPESDNFRQQSHNPVYSWILDNFAETSHILFTVFLSHRDSPMIHWALSDVHLLCSTDMCLGALLLSKERLKIAWQW